MTVVIAELTNYVGYSCNNFGNIKHWGWLLQDCKCYSTLPKKKECTFRGLNSFPVGQYPQNSTFLPSLPLKVVPQEYILLPEG